MTHAAIELGARPADEPRCLRLVTLGVVQGFLDHELLAALAGTRVLSRFLGDHHMADAVREVRSINSIGLAQRNGSLHDVLQLPDIAGPIVLSQQLEGAASELSAWQCGLRSDAVEEV